MKRVIPVILGLSVAYMAAVASAADGEGTTLDDLANMSLQDLLNVKVASTASRYSQDRRSASTVQTVLTARDIRAHGWRTLQELLSSVAGFYFSEDRNYNYIGVRGFNPPGDYNSRVLVLVDGHRLNENIYDSVGYAWDFPLDLENVEKVEIVRGPASVMYGSNALTAVIQVFTKKAVSGAAVRLKGDYLGPRSGRAFGTARVRLTDSELVVSASRMSRRGAVDLYFSDYDDPATHDGISEKQDGEWADRVFMKWSRKDWTVEAGASRRHKDIPTGAYETLFNQSGTHTQDEHAFGFVGWKKLWDKWEVEAKTALDAYLYTGDYLYSVEPIDVNQDWTKGVWSTTDAQALCRVFPNHAWLAGVEYRRDFRQDQRNWEGDTVNLDDHRHQGGFWGAFLQDEWKMAEDIHLTGGVRHDHYMSLDSAYSPRLALVWTPGSGSALKASWGNAFRVPNVYERFYNDNSATQKSPATLKSEKIRNAELSLEQWLGGGFQGFLTFFHNDVSNLIILATDPADNLLVYENLGRLETWGWGTGNQWSGNDGRVLRWSYAYAYVRDKATSAVPPNSPRHMAKAAWIEPLWGEKILGAVEGRWFSKRGTLKGGTVGDTNVVNATLTLSDWPRKGWSAQAGVFNVFDQKYLDPVSDAHLQEAVAHDGRIVLLSLTAAY